MSISTQIQHIRMEKNITQEEFGKLFHVTRQTVSNWENEKSYPDLQTLVAISDTFDVSLDVLLKDDDRMIKNMDRNMVYGTYVKKQKRIMDFLMGGGTGVIVSCLVLPASVSRTVTLCTGIAMVLSGGIIKARYDKKILAYFDEENMKLS